MRAFDQFRVKSCIDFKPRDSEEYYINIKKLNGYVLCLFFLFLEVQFANGNTQVVLLRLEFPGMSVFISLYQSYSPHPLPAACSCPLLHVAVPKNVQLDMKPKNVT